MVACCACSTRSSRRLQPGESALLFIDVDDLKLINDEYGHAGGDTVLRAVAGVLAGLVRKGDLAARLGGDEFAILLTGVSDSSQAGEVAARILNEMATPLVELNGNQVDVSASIGIATSNASESLDGEELVRRADVAMYAAKAAYKGVAVAWEHRLESTDETAATWTSDLERAVAERQFVLVLPAGRRVGLAADRRRRGAAPLAASSIRPAAHRTDSSTTSSQPGSSCRWANGCCAPRARRHVRGPRRWMSRWTSTSTSVRGNCRAPDFPHIVRRALEASRLDGNRLVLELTETSLIEFESGRGSSAPGGEAPRLPRGA